MPDTFYDGQTDYIQKLNAMAEAFAGGPYDSVPKSGGTMSGPLVLEVPLEPQYVEGLPVVVSTTVSVASYGAKPDGNNVLPFLAAAASVSNKIHFPRVDGRDSTYYFAAFSAGALDGLVLSVDDGVTLSLADNAPYTLYKNVRFGSDVPVVFRDINIAYVFPKSVSTYEKSALTIRSNAIPRNRIALNGLDGTRVRARSVAWPASDTFIEPAVSREADRLTFPPVADQRFQGPFIDLGPYETVSAYFDQGTVPGPVAAIVRGTEGFSVVYGVAGAGDYYTGAKPIGAPVQGNTASLTWGELGQGAYATYQADKSIWSITRTGAKTFVIKLNGRALTQPDMTALGDIVEVGFACYTAAAFSVSGLTVERRTDAVFGMQNLIDVAVFGDSTAEEFPGAWSKNIPQLLNGTAGLKVGTVTNRAVAGTTLAQAYTAMQTSGFGGASYVVVCSGTNDIQGLASLAAFKQTFKDICDYIIAAGRKPVVVIPWVWNPPVAGSGQPTSNYDKGAPYRMAMERIAFEKECVVVKTGDEMPNPVPVSVSAAPGMVGLRDRIHQDVLGYQWYSASISQAIFDDYCAAEGCMESALSPESFLNGAAPTADFKALATREGTGGVSGTLTVTDSSFGADIVELPRWCRPTRDLNGIVVLALGAGGSAITGSAYVKYTAATGRLSLQLAPALTRVLVFPSNLVKTI